MQGYSPYDHGSAGPSRQNRRPWSPPLNDERGLSYTRNLEQFLANSSHGWARGPERDQHYDDGEDELLNRHRNSLALGTRRGRREPSYEYEDIGGYGGYNTGYFNPYENRERRRGDRPRRDRRQEQSDVSVEALDLADYARILQRQQPQNLPQPLYPSFPPQYPAYPPLDYGTPPSRIRPLRDFDTAPPQRTFSPSHLHAVPSYPPPIDRPFSAQSMDTVLPPPSLLSGSAPTATTSPSANHIPLAFSPPLPPFVPPRAAAASPAVASISSRPRSARMEPDIGEEPSTADFPAWAKKWYANDDAARLNSSTPWRNSKDSPVYHSFPLDSPTNRDILPWTATSPGYDNEPSGTLPDNVKQERIRMLEREFGNEQMDEPANKDGNRIGDVDEKGNLVTAGPKKRIITRVFEALFALGTAVSGIYGALFINASKPPPAAGTAPALILYIFSSVTFLAIIYLFAIRPCMGRRRKAKAGLTGSNPAGMMVLPIAAPMGTSKKDKKAKRKGKKGMQGEGGNVQVNLIVDPTMFGTMGRDREERESDSDRDHNSTSGPTSSKGRRQGGRDRDRPSRVPRRSHMMTMALEEQWKEARSHLKKVLFVDLVFCIAWLGVFGYAIVGSSCPSGEFDGWCDAYNWARAGSCILGVTFAISVFFDSKDLKQSKISPRTRSSTARTAV